MKHLTLPLAAITLTVVAACTEPPPHSAPPDLMLSCGADMMQGLVGQSISAITLAELTVPYRVIRPGQAVTMDYNSERMNIELDAHDIITRIGCG